MIEIEKKFIVTEEQTKRLISGAEFLGEKILRNVQYDDVNYSLTSHDLWLRKRNGKFELKIPAQTMHDKTFISQYSELETEEEIRNAFPLPFTGKTLDEDLKEKGFFPFVDYVNTRKKYKKDEFSLDFDDADFSDFHYRMLEIELLVENCEDTKKAVEKIYKIKKRPKSKLLAVFVKDFNMAKLLAEIDKKPASANGYGEAKQERLTISPGAWT